MCLCTAYFVTQNVARLRLLLVECACVRTAYFVTQNVARLQLLLVECACARIARVVTQLRTTMAVVRKPSVSFSAPRTVLLKGAARMWLLLNTLTCLFQHCALCFKKVRHDHTVTWLAYWRDTISQKDFKYVFLGATSSFKAESDMAKYEKARKLKGIVGEVGLIEKTGAVVSKLLCIGFDAH